MRIAMFLDTDFPPDPRVENEASSLVDAGHDVYLFSLNYKRNSVIEERVSGINVIRFRASFLLYKLSALAYTVPFYHWLLLGRIRKFIRKVEPDILHIHDMPIAKAVLQINEKLKLPTVLDLHEDRPEIMKYYPHLTRGLGKYIIKPATWETWQRRLIQKVDFVVVVTELAKSVVLRKTNIEESKIIVVPNTIRSDLFYSYPINTSIIDKFDDTFNILYLGDTNKRRGTDTAIKSIAILKGSYPQIKLILVGSNTEDEFLKRLARDLNIEESISFEGWQDLSLFPSYLKAADIAISPLKRNPHHDTTLANKIFQYMAMAKPVIVSDCPAQAKVVKDSHAGLVHIADDPQSLAEKIVYLIEHREEKKKFGVNGRKAIDTQWDWRFTSKALIAFYNNQSKRDS